MSEIEKPTKKPTETLIKKLKLEPHPEGGYYKEIYRSNDTIDVPLRFGLNQKRDASTTIYYLLEGNDFSALHRIKSDEIWHFCEGSPITLYILDEDKKQKTIKIGNPLKNKEAQFSYCINHGNWFCATPDDSESFTLVTCTVSPGFDFKDFELADRKKLLHAYPEHRDLIFRFTR